MLYGGMTGIAGVLVYKLFAIGPLIVESGILAFLLLVVISSALSQLYGKARADRMVLWGFLRLAASIALIGLVPVFPPSPDMPTENLAAFYGEFPISGLLVGQAVAKVVPSFVLVPFLIVGAIAVARRLDARQAWSAQ